ncbi:MAG: TRAP transporter TatT component family protein, partial [Thermoanaerobaculia bacterium]
RREYREALEKALAIDFDAWPSDRLMNLISQRRARTLLAKTDDFFFVDESETTESQPSPAAEEETPDEKK